MCADSTGGAYQRYRGDHLSWLAGIFNVRRQHCAPDCALKGEMEAVRKASTLKPAVPLQTSLYRAHAVTARSRPHIVPARGEGSPRSDHWSVLFGLLASVWVELDKPTFNVHLRWTEVQYGIGTREGVQANYAEGQQVRDRRCRPEQSCHFFHAQVAEALSFLLWITLHVGNERYRSKLAALPGPHQSGATYG